MTGKYRKPLPEGVPELPDKHFYHVWRASGALYVDINVEGYIASSTVFSHRVSVPRTPTNMTLEQYRNDLLAKAYRAWVFEQKFKDTVYGEYSGQKA